MSSIAQFIQKSGFKVLAMARLSQCEYSTILYLMNCAVSGLEQIITTELELSALIGYDEDKIAQALLSLAERHLIKAHYSDSHPSSSAHPAIRLGFQSDMQRWLLDYEKNATSHDAVVYPFVRYQNVSLELLPGLRSSEPPAAGEPPKAETLAPGQRLLAAFLQGRSLDDEEIEQNQLLADILVQTHPLDQVLLILRHFKLRIPNLSLLASNWEHYQELFEQETQRVDFMDARKKHQELDERLRKSSRLWLERAEEQKLGPPEITILKLLIRHRYPRRQLFWAYQARSRYPLLEQFFEENASLMLAITTLGTIVKKHNPPHNSNNNNHS